jgi:hypothetical protein
MSSLWLWLAGAHALHLALSPVELCSAVDAVVVAQVIDVEHRYAPDGTLERLVHASVEETVKGPARKELDLVLPGGEVGGVRYLVSDTPSLVEGGRYLLFLHPQDGRLHVQGGEQGAVRITREGARRGVSLQAALASVEGCDVR